MAPTPQPPAVTRVASWLVLLLAGLPPAGAHAWEVAAQTTTSAVAALDTNVAPVQRVVDDYVGLYRKDTLAQWRELFLPTFTATSPAANGGVTVRALGEFYAAQERGFATAASMSETLDGVVIERSGRIATAHAGFVFHQNGTSRRGQLVLTLVESDGEWKIAALLFSY